MAKKKSAFTKVMERLGLRKRVSRKRPAPENKVLGKSPENKSGVG